MKTNEYLLNDLRYQLRVFPYTRRDCPKYITCNDCDQCGWGPMLTTEAWKSIGNFDPQLLRQFLCQPCMERRLKRPLNSFDLRDCSMNHFHPLYLPHGRV